MSTTLQRAKRAATGHLKGRPSSWLGGIAVAATLILATLLVIASILAYQSRNEEVLAEEWERHTLDVLSETAELRLANLAIVRGERGYILTKDRTFLEPYEEGKANALEAIATLETMVSDNAAQSQRIRNLRDVVVENLEATANAIAMTESGATPDEVERRREDFGRAMIEEIMEDIDAVETQQRALLSERTVQADAASYRESVFVRLLGIVGVLLLFLGGGVALALRRSLLREQAAIEELRRYAQTDELTGLANRREIFQSLDRMIGAAKRNGRPLSVAIFDIDHFKKVNDTFGHPAGDEVIRTVGKTALQVMRDQDLVGRLGGEEFIMAFPDCDVQQAAAACDRLLQAIAATPITIEDGKTLNITLSAGVTQLDPDDDRTALIANADDALYAAKQNGRDQVRLAA